MDDKALVGYINCEFLRYLGIDPEEGVLYLESKKAIDMNPVHIKAHQLLKQQVVASS